MYHFRELQGRYDCNIAAMKMASFNFSTLFYSDCTSIHHSHWCWMAAGGDWLWNWEHWCRCYHVRCTTGYYTNYSDPPFIRTPEFSKKSTCILINLISRSLLLKYFYHLRATSYIKYSPLTLRKSHLSKQKHLLRLYIHCKKEIVILTRELFEFQMSKMRFTDVFSTFLKHFLTKEWGAH